MVIRMKRCILAGWLVHLCCNNSLKMAPRCRNMYQFMYVMCITSRIAFVGYTTDCKNMHRVTNIKLQNTIKCDRL
jgi:hypothetical protein